MQSSNISRTMRLIFMAVTIVVIAVFGIFGASWATPARADGTVPPVGGGNGNGNSNNNSNSNNNGNNNANGNGPNNSDAATAATAVAGGCGSGPQVFSLTGSENVTKTLNVNVGTVALLSNQGGVGTGAIRPLFSPISSLTVNLVPLGLLNISPAGWTNLGCGILSSAKVADGRAATYILKGQKVCFDLPVGEAAAYKNLRIAYYDKNLTRWVFLTTTVGEKQACHSSFRLAPATFALFGGQ